MAVLLAHLSSLPHPDSSVTSLLTPQMQGLNNAVALDFDYREQMIYWTDVTTQGSMIRRMHLNGSNVQVRLGAGGQLLSLPRGPSLFQGHLCSSPLSRCTAPLVLAPLPSEPSDRAGMRGLLSLPSLISSEFSLV